jgi:hypothetical protein
VQCLTQQIVDGKVNPLVDVYLHRLEESMDEHHLKHLNFQAMLLSTYAFCCGDSASFNAYSQRQIDHKDVASIEQTDNHTSTINQLQGFISLEMLYHGIFDAPRILYDLRASRFNFSGMNLKKVGYHFSDLCQKDAKGHFLFSPEECAEAGFDFDEALKLQGSGYAASGSARVSLSTSNPMLPKSDEEAESPEWATKIKIWDAWLNYAQPEQLQLQASFLRLLTSMYLNNKILPTVLEQRDSTRHNPLPEIVDYLLRETLSFDKDVEKVPIRKARMSGGVLPLLYSYFKRIHPKNPHNGAAKQEGNDKDFNLDNQRESTEKALKELTECARDGRESNLPVPEVHLEGYSQNPVLEKDDMTHLVRESAFIILLHSIVYEETPSFQVTPQGPQGPPGDTGSKIKDKRRLTQMVLDKSDSNFDKDDTKFGAVMLDKHDVFFELIEQLTEDEEVLFVSEAKANVLNTQRKALNMLPIADTTQVHLISFLVFEVQKLELAPRWTTKSSEEFDNAKDSFDGKERKKRFGSTQELKMGEKWGYLHPLYPDYDMLLKKMINHVKDYLNKEVLSGYDTKQINTQIMQILTALLKDCEPPEDDDRNPDEPETEQDADKRKLNIKKYQKKQVQLGSYGAIALVLDVISNCEARDTETLRAALELGKQLLNGGNREVQDLIINHFKKNMKYGHIFFTKLKEHLEGISKTMKANPNFVKEYNSGVLSDPDSVFGDKLGLIFEFLQLWAEGHNRAMQEFMLSQDDSTVPLKKSVNLIGLSMRIFDSLTMDQEALRSATDATIDLLDKNMAFIIEAMQGPCTKVQDYIVDETAVVVYAKRVITFVGKTFDRGDSLRKSPADDVKCRFILMNSLIKACRVIAALMEGRGGEEHQKVYLEVLESMNVGLFKAHLTRVHSWAKYLEKGIEEGESPLRTESMWSKMCKVCWRPSGSQTTDDSTSEAAKVEKKEPPKEGKLQWVENMEKPGDKERMLTLIKESASELYTVYMQVTHLQNIPPRDDFLNGSYNKR